MVRIKQAAFDLISGPTCCPLYRGLVDSPILAGPVSGRGFPIRFLDGRCLRVVTLEVKLYKT